MKRSARGISLLEVVAVLGVAAILAGISAPMVKRFLDSRKLTQAMTQLRTLKEAMVGHPHQVVEIATLPTSQFGYHGDMGRLPTSLTELIVQGSQPSYVVDAATQVGVGWHGPYLDPPEQDLVTLDPWGNSLIYTTTPFTDPLTGATVVARLRSPGADLTSTTSDDLTVDIYRSDAIANVIGFVKDSQGLPLRRVTTNLSFASNAVVTTSSFSSDADGRYQFQDIPLGERAIQVDPKILFVANSAFSVRPDYNAIEMLVANYSKDPITINSFIPEYESSPQSYFKEVKINGTSVFSNFNPRGASGQTIPFPSVTLSGSSVIQPLHRVRLQHTEMVLPDFMISSLGTGATMKIEMIDFDDATSGNSGNNVDMTGVSMQLTFSDGSITITLIRRKK